jgi:hypothetical protein
MRRELANSSIDELKIDKDCFVNKDWLREYVEVIVGVCGQRGVTVEAIRMCASKKKGLHFYIKISPPVEPMQADLLQFLLGDDALRVDFNRARIESGLAEWNKLFEVEGRRLSTIYRKEKG